MRFKNLWLATTAAAALAGAQQASAEGLYVSVFGGLNQLQDTSGEFFPCCTFISYRSDADTGFALGGALGTDLDKWLKGLRIEMEVSYRRNDIAGTWVTTESHSTGGILDGDMSTFAIMANAWYEIDVGSKFRPYVGGGVGWARMRGAVAFITTFTFDGSDYDVATTNRDENTGFAWQLGVGINYEVMPDVDLGIGYRYFKGPDFHDTMFDGKSRFDNDNHQVHVNLTVGIN